MSREDLCNRLGIPLINDKSELKTIWRKLVLKYHPDRNKVPDAEKSFILIQKLFDELTKSFNESEEEYIGIRININPANTRYYENATTQTTFTWRYS